MLHAIKTGPCIAKVKVDIATHIFTNSILHIKHIAVNIGPCINMRMSADVLVVPICMQAGAVCSWRH